MSNRKRKHGIFSVSSEAVEMINAEETQQQKPTGKPIAEALNTVFTQMKVAGNRPRTIESYSYIFKQFVEMNSLEYVEEINIEGFAENVPAVEQRKRLVELIQYNCRGNGGLISSRWVALHKEFRAIGSS